MGKKLAKFPLTILVLLSLVGWGPFSIFEPYYNPERMGTNAWRDKEVQLINSQAYNLDPYVLKLSLNAYLHARRHGLDGKGLLTIIDYSKPSTEKRLWVVDLRHTKVLFNTWVTHGKNTGNLNATSFSNEPGSLKSSIGVFLTTGQPYVGSNGYSLRIQGLERGINDNAYRRDIVFHGAWYAGGNVAREYGLLGRSWGCPAVNLAIAKPLIDTIKDNTLVVAYYPDRFWFNTSTFLSG